MLELQNHYHIIIPKETTMTTNQDLKKRDLKHIWHPCSQMKDYEQNIPLIPIKKALGVHLYDYDGNQYIDGISSWWVNILGHNHPQVSEVLKKQIDSLSHVIFAGFTHEPAIELSEKIISLTSKKLNKVFFADNGSSGVEAALKMSFHYFKLQNQTRSKFISLKNSYHGETIGAMSISDVELYKSTYHELLLQNVQIDLPYERGADLTDEILTTFIASTQAVIDANPDCISSIIIEPLVQCAGSMKMYDTKIIQALHALCSKNGLLFIADEIAVGFGRTGSLFAYEQAEIEPDILLLSKSLTAGYLPLCLVVTSDELYDAFYDDYNTYKAFLHSHSYSGNALACSVANATIDVIQNENIIQTNQDKIAYLGEKIKIFEPLERVLEVRQQGMIVAIELDFDIQKRINLDIYKYCLGEGVYVRPLANVLYFMPPYIITNDQIDTIIGVAFAAVQKYL